MRLHLALLGTALLVEACGPEAAIVETAPPVVGSVRARVVSSFLPSDLGPGVDLPSGLQVFVADGAGAPLADAAVTVYPGGEEPQPMAHQGGGRYELDVLSGRMSPPQTVYFFEVVSEFLEPERTVLRVPHEPLVERPEVGVPADRSEQPRDEALTVMWLPVEGADCYDVGARQHELQDWTWAFECVDQTTAVLGAETVRDISFVRVRARRSVGDPDFELQSYYGESTASAEVRIFLVDAR